MDDAKQEWRAHTTQITKIDSDNEQNHKDFQAVMNNIKEAILSNNCWFTEEWEKIHKCINHRADKHIWLKNHVIELESLSSLQQTVLQSCQNQIAGLEETVEQLVLAVWKLEKTVCWCHNQLLSLGPHYLKGRRKRRMTKMVLSMRLKLLWQLPIQLLPALGVIPNLPLTHHILLLWKSLILRTMQFFRLLRSRLVLKLSWPRLMKILSWMTFCYWRTWHLSLYKLQYSQGSFLSL